MYDIMTVIGEGQIQLGMIIALVILGIAMCCIAGRFPDAPTATTTPPQRQRRPMPPTAQPIVDIADDTFLADVFSEVDEVLA